jgi:hypothetical protein
MRAMSRRPSGLRRRQRPPGRARPALLATVAAVTTLIGGGPLRMSIASAADDPGHLLDPALVDAAWVDRGSSGPPDLLTMSLSDAQLFGNVSLTLLRRDATWRIQAQTQLQLGSDFDGSSPWLLQLGPGRFAVLANTNNATGTITTINLDEANQGAITVDRRVDTDIAIGAAGVTDVDGDGTPELVLGGVVGGYEAQCPTMALAVLDTDERLTLRRQVKLQAANGAKISYFVGSAFGAWDGKPGTDLLTQAYDCTSNDGASDAYHLLAIRLADLSTIHDLHPPGTDAGPSPLANVPAAIDIDRDGRNEAVLGTSAGLSVVDPADGWSITPFATAQAALVGIVDRPGQPGASVVELRATGDAPTSGVAVERISRVDGRVRVDGGQVRTTDWVPQQALASTVQYFHESAWMDQPPVTIDDLDDDGCPDLVAPLVLIGCAGTGPLEPAPAWIATRPLALVGQGADRRMLVAVGLDWYASPGGTVEPSPLAAHQVDAWHVLATSRFALAEVPLAQGSGVPTFPAQTVPLPAIEHPASQEGVVDVRRPAGTRLLARVIASGGPGNILKNATDVATPLGFLYSNLLDTEWAGSASTLTNLQSAIGYGSEAAVDRLMLAPNVMNQDGTIAKQWTVTIAALDATGTLSTPVQATAVVDVENPVTKLDTPTFSAPWPFTATMHGTSEPGASVSLTTGAGSPVVVRADGTFDLPVQLAPWPQDVGVLAIDPAGNESRTKASVMGGVDLRGLPWPAIGVVVVLAGVFLSSLRGVRSGGVRQIRQIAVDVNDENATVIEELSVGRIERRD